MILTVNDRKLKYHVFWETVSSQCVFTGVAVFSSGTKILNNEISFQTETNGSKRGGRSWH